MDFRDKSILYQVAFKAATKFVIDTDIAETEDVVGEVFALTDAFFENLETRVGSFDSGSKGKAKTSSSRKSGGKKPSSGGSNKPGSKPSGKTGFTIKNPDEPATEGQWNKLVELGVDIDELSDDLTKGEASDLIQENM